MDLILFYICVPFYTISMVLYLIDFVKPLNYVKKVAFNLSIIAFFLHILSIIFRYTIIGIFPTTNFYEAVSFFSCLIFLSSIIWQIKYKLPSIAIILCPLGLILVILALFTNTGISDPPASLKSYWMPLHCLMAFTGNACLASAFCFSIAYIIQAQSLKQKKIGTIFKRLPSLHRLDSMHYISISIALIFITFGIITGALWSRAVWGKYWVWEARQTWSLIIWFLIAAIFHLRMVLGFRGRKAALLTVFVFLILLSSFILINVFELGKHSMKFN